MWEGSVGLRSYSSSQNVSEVHLADFAKKQTSACSYLELSEPEKEIEKGRQENEQKYFVHLLKSCVVYVSPPCAQRKRI